MCSGSYLFGFVSSQKTEAAALPLRQRHPALQPARREVVQDVLRLEPANASRGVSMRGVLVRLAVTHARFDSKLSTTVHLSSPGDARILAM